MQPSDSKDPHAAALGQRGGQKRMEQLNAQERSALARYAARSRWHPREAQAAREKALRVAWRITKDWVEAQLAIIETQMVTTAQVFLPYAVTANGQTLYEYIGQNTQLLLGEGNK